MEFIYPSRLALSIALLAAAGASPLAAQTAPEVAATPYQFRPVSNVTPTMPFPPGSGSKGASRIEFRSPDQMTEADRNVEADGESSIRERVNFTGFEFNEGQWSYHQIVCPVFPHHLLLTFTRNSGKGDESVFTASIPRGGDGGVRIIPVQRKGYSLFSPAPVNALTISTFNRIRAEENPQTPPDWLTTGMCYAALAGAHPQVALDLNLAPKDLGHAFPSGMTASLVIPAQGGAIIHFLDVAALPVPREWTMIFNAKGVLVKASHTPAPPIQARLVPPGPEDLKGTLMPPTATDLNWKPVPDSGEKRTP